MTPPDRQEGRGRCEGGAVGAFWDGREFEGIPLPLIGRGGGGLVEGEVCVRA